MALTNCSISSTTATFTKTGGSLIGSTTAVLTITPDTGYTISAANFANNTGGLAEVAAITLTDSGTPGAANNTVLVTILLNAGFVMPSANHTVTVDIDGAADALVYSISGTYNFSATPSSAISESEAIGVSYSNTGTQNLTETLFTKTFTPTSSYEWASEPTAVLDTGATPAGVDDNYSNYTITKTGSGSTSSRTFTVQYKYPAADHSGDVIDLRAALKRRAIKLTADSKGNVGPRINNFSINRDYLNAKGDLRPLEVWGDSGAKFKVVVYSKQEEVTRGTRTVNTTRGGFTTNAQLEYFKPEVTLGDTGYVKINLTFPPTDSVKTYTITIISDDLHPRLITHKDDAVFTMLQLANVAITVQLTESAGSTMTMPATQATSSKTSGYTPFNNDGTRGDAYSFSFDVASAGSDPVFCALKARKGNYSTYITKTDSSGWSIQLTSITIENNGHASNVNFVIAFKVIRYGRENVTAVVDTSALFKVLSAGTNTPNNLSTSGTGTEFSVSKDPYNTARAAAGAVANAADTTAFASVTETVDMYQAMTALTGTTKLSLVDNKYYKIRKGAYNSGEDEYIAQWNDTDGAFDNLRQI